MTALRVATIGLVVFLSMHWPDAMAQPSGEASPSVRRISAAVLVWGLLAIISVTLVVVGGGWLIVRLGRRVRSSVEEERVRPKYFDLSVKDRSAADTAEDESDDDRAGRP